MTARAGCGDAHPALAVIRPADRHIDSGALDPEQVEPAGQRLPGGDAEPRAEGRHVGVVDQDAAGPVEGVELRRQLAEVRVDPVRRPLVGCREHDEREARQLEDQRLLVLLQRDLGHLRGRLLARPLLERAQDAADARVRVLDVVDGVLARLLHDELEVDVEGRVVRARHHREARRVDADGLDQVVDRDDRPLALGHALLLAALEQVHELPDDELEPLGVVRRQGGEGRLHARHVAVVVGAPDVDQVLPAAVGLVAVVGDVGEEVGGLAARADQDAVLVVAVPRRLEPDGAVLLVEQVLAVELGERLGDLAVEPAVLARPLVERSSRWSRCRGRCAGSRASP